VSVPIRAAQNAIQLDRPDEFASSSWTAPHPATMAQPVTDAAIHPTAADAFHGIVGHSAHEPMLVLLATRQDYQ